MDFPQRRSLQKLASDFVAPTKTDKQVLLEEVVADWNRQAEDAMNGLPTKTDNHTK